MEGYGNENPGAFQPTRPLRGATCHNDKLRRPCLISTHAPLAGRDSQALGLSVILYDFNPRAPCGARLPTPRDDAPQKEISTHAPLAGRDRYRVDEQSPSPIFQPTRPLRGATPLRMMTISPKEFQPTRPLRGATAHSRAGSLRRTDFNPRAPCGARRRA